MSLKGQIEQKLEENLLLLGYSLVKLNIIYGKKRNKIEVIIYSKEGITHQDCNRVTKMIKNTPDIESQFGEQYLLEVSSPGLYRKITTLREYRVFQEKLIEFALKEQGVPRFGLILKVGEDEQIILKDKKTQEEVKTSLENIQYAKLADDKGD